MVRMSEEVWTAPQSPFIDVDDLRRSLLQVDLPAKVIARRSGVSEKTLRDFLRCRRSPASATLEKLAFFLELHRDLVVDVPLMTARELVAAIRDCGLSNAELSRRSGVGAQTIGTIVRGEVIPKLETIRRLTRVLKASEDKRLGQRIISITEVRQRMRELGLSITELAKLSRVDRASLSEILSGKKGRRPRPKTMWRISRALYLYARRVEPIAVKSGQDLRDARLARGWSRSELAARARVSARTIWSIENGQYVGYPATLRKLWEAIERCDVKAAPARIIRACEIREARLKAGLSQYELAERAGVSQCVISRLEVQRKGGSEETLYRLTMALNGESVPPRRKRPRTHGTSVSKADGGRNPDRATRVHNHGDDPTAYVPMSRLYHERFASAGQCTRFLDEHRDEIRTQKPSSRRRLVHAGDWYRYWAKYDRQRSELLDDDRLQEVIADIEARKAEERRRKARK